MKRLPFVTWFNGHPIIAAIVGFFLPGIPQFLMGDVLIGLILIIIAFAGIIFPPAFIIGIISAVHAYWLSEHVYEEGGQE